MYTGYYLTRLIAKERQMQLMAEVVSLRQTKAIESKKRHESKRTIDSIADFIRSLGAILFRKKELLSCKC